MTAESDIIRELYEHEKAVRFERSRRGGGSNGRPSAAVPSVSGHESVSNRAHAASEPAKGSARSGRNAKTPEVVIADGGARAESARAGESEEMLLDAYWASYGDPSTRVALRSAAVRESMAEVVIEQDDRVEITNTAAYPWRAIASLRITAPDGSGFIGTGWMVSPRLMLTAGHCIFMHDEGGWATQIEVIPGRRGTEQPFGSCIATDFRSVTGWTQSRDSQFDYGAILLPADCRFGDQVGWFGYEIRSDENLQDVKVNISGYPGDKPSGTQWFHSNAITGVAERVLTYQIDTFGGQSGAPVWVFIKDRGRFGVGVHVNGSLAGNSATRITADVAANIAAWAAEVP